MSIPIGPTTLSEFTRTLPDFQQLIRTISRSEEGFVYNTQSLPESWVGQEIPKSGKISYGVLLQNYEELAERAGQDGLFDDLAMVTLGTAGDGIPGQTVFHDDVTNELLDLNPLELDTLLHAYLASARAVLNFSIDTHRNEGFKAPPSFDFAIHEISRNLFLAQNYLRLMNRSDRNYFYEGSPSVDRLVQQLSNLPNKEDPTTLDETELYRLGRLSLTTANAVNDELLEVSGEYGENIDRKLGLASGATQVAKTLLGVKGLQLEGIERVQ